MTLKDLNKIATQKDLHALRSDLFEKIEAIYQAITQLKPKHQSEFPPGTSKLFYTPKEFADLIGVSKSTVIRRCQDGTYKSTQPGGHGTAIMIPRSEVKNLENKAHNLD